MLSDLFQEDLKLICEMVALLHSRLRLPLSCKIRILQDIDETVSYARSLNLQYYCIEIE